MIGRASLLALPLVLAACGQPLGPAGPASVTTTTASGDLTEVVETSNPDLEDPTPSAIRRFDVIDAGTALRIHYAGGDPECYGLHHVDVAYERRRVVVGVYEGTRPGSDGCPDIGIWKVTTVPLDEPVRRREIVDRVALTSG